MKLYLDTKKLSFDEEDNEIEHEVIISIRERDFIGCDCLINLPANSQFIKDTLKIGKIGNDDKEIRQFKVRADGWFGFPLYEVKEGKIMPFNYTKYAYFINSDRREVLSSKIKDLYNPSSEAKILRKTLKYVMDILNIEYPENFKKYNDKIEILINKNSKI